MTRGARLALLLTVGCIRTPERSVDANAPDEGGLYPDADADGYGSDTAPGTLCEGPGFSTDPSDCDDTDASVHPGVVEVCGDADANCDGERLCNVQAEALWAYEEQDGHHQDLDGDGLAELLIGAALLASPASARLPDVASQELWDVGTTSSLTGKSVSEAGDMDGDGALDLAVGAHASVWIIPFDLSTSFRTLDEGARITGTHTDFADVVANAGDVDGDGLDDLIVGHEFDDTGGTHAGRAWVFLGGGLAWGAEVSAGDFDGPSLPDVAIKSAFTSEQAVHVLLNDTLTTGTVEVWGNSLLFHTRDTDTHLSGPVCINGDATGDGKDDLLIPSAYWPGTETRGAAWLVEGR